MIPLVHGPPKFFLPHHGIFKTHGDSSKIRVVFNGSAKSSSGVSLNDILYPGPKLQSNISDVLCLFQLLPFVFICDIEQMFRQIVVHPEDQAYQCILWRDCGTDPVQTFLLTTVTYGTASAPWHALRTLRQLAYDHMSEFPVAARIIIDRSFVDDLHGGGSTVPEALQARDELISLLAKGGFSLKKWAANTSSLLDGLSPLDLLPSGQEDLVDVLGLKWQPQRDFLTFPVDEWLFSADTFSKRSVLAQTARLFDPCGWISPVVFTAKSFMQQLWRHSLDWDSPLPHELLSSWTAFIRSLSTLSSLKVPRFIPSSCSGVHLHGFCDASSAGYAAAIYLRSSSGTTATCHLIASKTRVAPLKPVTIPRLELMGAHLLAKLYFHYYNFLTKHLSISHVYLWTDSTIVLDWIHTPPHLLKIFVGNRVSQILELSEISQWHHIAGIENPADIASRGLSPLELMSSSLWWEGPSFLSKNSEQWPLSAYIRTHSDDALELKPPVTLLSSEPCLFEKISSWSRLVRVTTIIVRWRLIASHTPFSPYSCRMAAINLLLRYIQRTSSLLQDYNSVSRGSIASPAVQRLLPFVDEVGVLRAKGRLVHSSFLCNKFPVILPKDHPFVNLLIQHFHISLGHAGPSQVQFQLSMSYWILSARQLIRKVIHRCITCFKAQPRPSFPLMSDLPAERVNPSPPFYHTGMDFAGPFVLKSSSLRKAPVVKAYLCLFICLATKAVHLEVALSLTTQEFLDCLRRFVSRRGLPRKLYSDCGLNFIGARTVLSKELSSFLKHPKNSQIILQYALDNSIEFVFSCPAAPHQNGLWERAIKSAKFHLRRIIGAQILTVPQFVSVTIQIEGILNSRPLTPVSSDLSSFDILTPGHFLIGRPLTSPPAEDLTLLNGNLRHYQLIRALVQRFWKRWRLEYLTTLQARSKWNSPTSNLQPGDLVIVDEPNCPSYQWPTGRVLQVFPGSDGVVRRASVKTSSGIYDRPAVKLFKLPIDQTG